MVKIQKNILIPCSHFSAVFTMLLFANQLT
jgi:hypothetical protein